MLGRRQKPHRKVSKSTQPEIILRQCKGEIILNRAGFLGAMKISKPFEPDNSAGADGGE